MIADLKPCTRPRPKPRLRLPRSADQVLMVAYFYLVAVGSITGLVLYGLFMFGVWVALMWWWL